MAAVGACSTKRAFAAAEASAPRSTRVPQEKPTQAMRATPKAVRRRLVTLFKRAS